ncbi:dicarboxylate/amino acid:cation symporter [Sphingomonas hankyongi]|uniref:Dicarboxylate/amino acid:cation symporter n=1 Tax=Sphingomonas hankyongi TaxID=2908209 RepID=A0ABT0S1X9_9SPHN|nr:cation:dicarboxylase symporter family transporter [Sphingomonas hankyongi]MCL6729869.1 dicarboxylate/amino acid:cation symporter [Sphingomonas hankyongi]
MSPPVRILTGLGLGLAGGFALASAGVHPDSVLVTTADTIGGLWIAALRMTILPLIFALVVTGVASRVEASSAGGLTRLSLLTFVSILLVGSAIVGIIVPTLLSLWPISQGATAVVRQALSTGSRLPPLPGLGEMLKGFVPINVFSAAAADNMLPVVMFALVFGFAVASGPGDRRLGLSTFFEWIRETMLVIVGWVLLLAPVGVFMLALELGAKTGLSAIGALAQFVVLVIAMAVLAVAFAFCVAVFGGRSRFLRFARAAAPAQSIAFSTRSSVATLPAMISACENQLQLPQKVTSVTVPLAVSVFRICGPMSSFTGAIYAAHVLGVPLGTSQLVTGGLIAIIIIAAGAGVPGEITFFATYVPIFNSMGIPIEILALMIAVNAIPDMFNTVANVTMDMAVTTLVARLASRRRIVEAIEAETVVGE